MTDSDAATLQIQREKWFAEMKRKMAALLQELQPSNQSSPNKAIQQSPPVQPMANNFVAKPGSQASSPVAPKK